MWVMNMMKHKLVPLGTIPKGIGELNRIVLGLTSQVGTIPKGIGGIESNCPGIDIPGYLKCNGFAIK